MAAEEQGQSVSEGAANDGGVDDGLLGDRAVGEKGPGDQAPAEGDPANPGDRGLHEEGRGDPTRSEEGSGESLFSDGTTRDGASGDGTTRDGAVAGSGRGSGQGTKQTRWWMELLVVVVAAVLIAFLLRTFVVATYSIPSASMEPTLMIGDRIVVDKLSYHLHGVGTGDVVVFSTPPEEDCAGPPVSDLVKRVIALSGQTISLSEGKVYINGSLLPEPWLPPAVRSETYPGPAVAPYSLHHPYRVPSGDVYVMGDNRPESCDSRYWGPIRESTIVGKVDVRVWPLSRFAFF